MLYICPMEYREAKSKFIESWGALGGQWGINKTMAQIHALLMVTDEALSMEEVMEELNISRGNASMNLRSLIDWGIVFKTYKSGERKEYFVAEKDLNELAIKISQERSKREIKPALKVLKEVSSLKDPKNKEEKHFVKQTTKLYKFVGKADNIIDKITEYKDNWLTQLFAKLIK